MGTCSWGRRWITLASVIAGLGVLAPAALASAPTSRLGSAPQGQSLKLVLPLRANLTGLESFARAVSTVGSPLYGDYQPVAVLARRFGASPKARAQVLSYLRQHGATHARIDTTGLFADATMSVGRAERLFGTALASFHSARAGRFIAPTEATRLPAALQGAATGVVGLNTQPLATAQATTTLRRASFGHTPMVPASPSPTATPADGNTPSGYSERSGTASGCPAGLADRGFTPNQYLTAYDFNPLYGAGFTGRGERVALVEIDGFRYSDLRAFSQCFGLAVPAINGFGVNLRHPLGAGPETTLDLQLLDASAPGLKAIDVYESRALPADVLESLTAPLQNPGRVPQVISASLGVCEPALQLAIGLGGIRSVEGALALSTASGISVLAAAGDAGSSSCIVRGQPVDGLALSYPASSPFVTSVGGTNFTLNAANQIQSQTVWNDAPFDVAAGGGGSSYLFTRPSYQRGFVRANRRAVPDVSMLADVEPGYNIYCTAKPCAALGGSDPWIAVGGTSAASPLLAGGLALVDQLVRSRGRQELGLVNSLFYRIAAHYASGGAFSDVVSGNNDLGAYITGGNHRPLNCCTAGPGYDRASGLGSVDLAKFALLAVGLQPPVAQVGLLLPGQRPLLRRHLVARVSCSRTCDARAVATIAVPRGGVVNVSSRRFVFVRRGRHVLQLPFSRRQLRRLRTALHSRGPLYASVVAQISDSGGNVEGQTRVHKLRIRH